MRSPYAQRSQSRGEMQKEIKEEEVKQPTPAQPRSSTPTRTNIEFRDLKSESLRAVNNQIKNVNK